MDKKIVFSPSQDNAADPQKNVWVQANAGTGKTSVLTKRLLRILFRTSDVTKSGILCLTYTKIAVAEMRNRILKELKNWILKSDEELMELLDDVAINKPVTLDDVAHARKIFFTYIDNPDILKIKTIHSFCEEILHRFPVEAHISPTWQVVTGADEKALLWDCFVEMMSDASDARTEAAFSHIMGCMSEYSLNNLSGLISQHNKDFYNVSDFEQYREYFIGEVKKYLEISEPVSDEIPVADLQNIIATLDAKINAPKVTKKVLEENTKWKQRIQDYINGNVDFEEYRGNFMQKNNGAAKNIKLDILLPEQDRVCKLYKYQEHKTVLDDTIALFDLSAAFAKKYRDVKASKNLLDFNDLIINTYKLLSNRETMGWVLSQMDVSISHILVDEAQDTGGLQWDILRMLTEDFFDEGDTTDLPRSLFVVGDIKQSIFRFQGAEPTAFIHSRDEIAAQIKNAKRAINNITLDENHRSLPSVLYAVDKFFDDADVQEFSGFENQRHYAGREKKDGLGCVELHKMIARGITGETTADFIKTISEKIKSILDTGKYAPKDIMVLLQRRDPFADLLITRLKKMGIAVVGSDKITLPQFPAIRDLLNLIRFCLDNADDYSLCCVLKSPLYRFSERKIYDLCKLKNKINDENKKLSKPKTTVFQILQNFDNATYSDLLQVLDWGKKLAPYSFFSAVLQNNNNRQKMIAALGEQIIDPLEEFMTICLSYERTQSGTLKEFLKWFVTGGSEVKRDMEAATGVRILTVHSSKGLETPVVFLIDTHRIYMSENILPLPIKKHPTYATPYLWSRNSNAHTDVLDFARSTFDFVKKQEYFRLLYVAMTRARNELYIYGYNPDKNPNQKSWHYNLWRVFSQLCNAPDDQEYIRIEHDY